VLDRAAGALEPGGPAAGAGPADETPSVRPSLPIGAVVLALIQVAEGLWLLAALAGVGVAAEAGWPAQLMASGAPGQYAIIGAAGLRFAAALGLLTRHRAAWVLAMLVTGGGLLASLAGYVSGRPDDIRLLLDVAAAFYLNQPGVRAAFGVRAGRPR